MKEVELRTKQQEEDRKFHKEDKKRMHGQVEKYADMQRKYRNETKNTLRAESQYRAKFTKEAAKTSTLEAEIKLLKAQVSEFENYKEEHVKHTEELNLRIHELETALENSESSRIKLEANWKAYQSQRKEGQDLV